MMNLEGWEINEIYRLTGESFNINLPITTELTIHYSTEISGYTAVKSTGSSVIYLRFFEYCDATVEGIILHQINNYMPFLYVVVEDSNILLCAGTLLVVRINRFTCKTTFEVSK